jgi:hypothetical protein
MALSLSVYHGTMLALIEVKMAVEELVWASKDLPLSTAGLITPVLTKLAACYVSLHRY